jgi:hypothetical protein
MNRNRPPEDIATTLKALYDHPFGGKDRGRYKISRRRLRRLSGRKRLEDNIVKEIIDEAYEQGLIMMDLGDDFVVIEETVMQNYRTVPLPVLSKYSSS